MDSFKEWDINKIRNRVSLVTLGVILVWFTIYLSRVIKHLYTSRFDPEFEHRMLKITRDPDIVPNRSYNQTDTVCTLALADSVKLLIWSFGNFTETNSTLRIGDKCDVENYHFKLVHSWGVRGSSYSMKLNSHFTGNELQIHLDEGPNTSGLLLNSSEQHFKGKTKGFIISNESDEFARIYFDDKTYTVEIKLFYHENEAYVVALYRSDDLPLNLSIDQILNI